MSAITEAAEALWAAEVSIQVLLEKLPDAAAEASAPTPTLKAVTALVESAQRHLEKAHTLSQEHLASTGQPIPASGGGNKPPQ